jgi:diaminohydroxyphosphoribosylaminopyrimidine deaminase / 5-amino-6-(5-phosphoribosylamino)uracil reductase
VAPIGDPDRTGPDPVWMRRALELAALGRGTTSPNPMVGAVLVRGGVAVGEGFHRAPGEPHAEAVALREAAGLAAGATCYVTLEPCGHHGRTPPCAAALIAAGVTRVVAAIEDPDPNVRGKGFAQLRAAGVQVEVGVGAAAAEAQNAAFLLHRRQGRPRVTLKAAASLDGKVAAPDGTSQWITGEAARADAHRLRAEADAVAVGAGTALADDPRLTVRLPGWSGRQPLRVLLDATGRTVTGPTGRGGPAGATASGQLFDGAAPTLVATTVAAPRAALQAWAAAGAEVLVCPDAPAASGEAGVDLAFVAKSLGERGVLELLVEGGPRLHASFWEAGLADRLVWYLAPLVIGGDGAPGLLPAAGARTLTAARAVRIETVDRLGPDLRIVGYPQEGT